MSQENVEIVRRMYEAFHLGDAEGARGEPLVGFNPRSYRRKKRLTYLARDACPGGGRF